MLSVSALKGMSLLSIRFFLCLIIFKLIKIVVNEESLLINKANAFKGLMALLFLQTLPAEQLITILVLHMCDYFLNRCSL
jgi:hypothetical protein